jgi:hypothetical protein
MIMKKFLSRIVLCAAAVLSFAACSNPEEEKMEIIAGEWHYTTTESGVQIDVYLGLYTDYTFDLYQKIGDGPHYLYKGKYEFDGQILSGTYSDYTPWANDYQVTRSGSSLTLTSVSAPDYSVTYVKESIPESVKTHYMPATKAGESPMPIL